MKFNNGETKVLVKAKLFVGTKKQQEHLKIKLKLLNQGYNKTFRREICFWKPPFQSKYNKRYNIIIQRNQKNSFLNCADEAVKDATTVQKRVVDALKIKTKVLNLS